MDIGVSQITGVVASSTGSYLTTYSPLFLMVGGLVLALVVIGAIIEKFTGSKEVIE